MKYNVTVQRFHPEQGSAGGVTFILPVDSPDAEHAVSAAMSNAIAFSPKMQGTAPLPVAFCCLAVSERP